MQMALIEFVVFLSVVGICSNGQNGDNSTCIQNISWSNETFRSNPLCIDENFNIVTWDPSDDLAQPCCKQTQKYINPCPVELTAQDDFCIMIKTHTQYPLNCPYEDPLVFSEYLSKVPEEYFPIWMPVQRVNDEVYGIGLLYWMEPSKYKSLYMIDEVTLLENYTVNGSIVGKDCMIYYFDSTSEAVACDEHHTGICAYKQLHKKPKTFCSQNFNYTNCKQSDYSTKSPCFCLFSDNKKQAEFIKPYQNLLFKNLSNTCYIGLEQVNGRFVWSGSQTPVSYSAWAQDVDFHYKYGVISNSGWKLQEENQSHCVMYEVETPPPTQNLLYLLYNAIDNLFIITAHYPNLLQNIQSTTPVIYCFTDASNKILLAKLPITKQGDDPVAKNVTYSFSPHVKGPGNYWCEGFVYPDLEPVKSNVWFLRNPQKFPGEYVGIFKHQFINNTNPLRGGYMEYLERLISLSLLNASNTNFHPRIFAITEIDSENPTMIFISHFTFTTAENTLEEFQNLEESLRNRLPNIELLELRNADYCLSTNSNFDGAMVTWPKTPISTEAHAEGYYCLTSDGKVIPRTCSGNFVHGAMWSEVPCRMFETSNSSGSFLSYSNCQSSISLQILECAEELVRNNIKELKAVDVYFISRIIENISEKSENEEEYDLFVNSTARIISNLAEVSTAMLDEAQIYLNATDRIVYFFKECLKRSNGSFNLVLDNLLVLTNVQNLGISGLIIKDGTKKFITEPQINIELSYDYAILFSEALLQQLREELAELTMVVYFNDYFFRENSAMDNVVENVFLIEIITLRDEFSGPVEIYANFNNTIRHDMDCVTWRYKEGDEVASWWESSEVVQANPVVQCDFNTSAPVAIRFSKSYFDNITDALLELLNEGEFLDDNLRELQEITLMPLQAQDVFIISEILQVIADKGSYSGRVSRIINNLMLVNKNVMEESQIKFNATDYILTSINKIFQNSNVTTVTENFNAISDFLTKDILGISKLHCAQTCALEVINKTDNITQLFNRDDFEAALIFSDELLRQIAGSGSQSKFIVTMYSNDVFFNEQISVGNTTKIFGIEIPDVNDNFQGPVKLYYKTSSDDSSCAFWNYSNFKGSWSRKAPPKQVSSVVECDYSTSSYFTLVVSSSGQNVTEDLENILNSTESSEEKLAKVDNITQKSHSMFGPIDIFLIAEIMERAANINFNNLKITTSIVSNLMNVPKYVMKDSQSSYSATDKILFSVDEIAANHQAESTDFYMDDNFNIVVANLTQSNITGILLDNCSSTCDVTILTKIIDDKLEINSITNSFEAAVLFSKALLQQLRNAESTKLVITSYLNDVFFNEDTNHNTSKIFGVLLPNFTEKFQGYISIVYNINNAPDDVCAFWNYNLNGSAVIVNGSWEEDSEKHVFDSRSVCHFDHVTHFAMLLANDPGSYDDINKYKMLDLITNINCGLSLAGVCLILLTAVLFEKWRRNTGNQILVNFCFAISIKIAMLYISDSVYEHESLGDLFCTICGAILHYAILSEFFWMLIIAILQFKRFVEVLGGPPKYILAKACVCGWIFPLLPVLCILIVNRNNYTNSNVGLCYPTELGLYLGVWLPIIIIVAINVVIFVYIMYNVCHKKTESRETVNHEMLFQWRLALLLFSMLGITWLFGFLAQIDGFHFCVYLFCFLATLQGFVMFLFFIVFNKSTRLLYAHAIKLWLYSKNLKKL